MPTGLKSTQLSTQPKFTFDLLLVLGIVIYLIATLSSYDVTWTHPEVPQYHMPHALDDGPLSPLQVVFKSFDTTAYEGETHYRSRFLSYFVAILNVKFRVWLFQFLPPHPSFSLMWILNLVLAPLLMFKWVHLLTSERRIAFLSSALYMISPGVMSLSATLFHPAKPLANFFFLLCLYVAAPLWRHVRAEGHLQRSDWKRVGLLIFCLSLTLFSDESAAFVWLCLPVFYFELFKTHVGKIPFALIYLVPILFFLGFNTFVMPPLSQVLGFGEYSFWGYMGAGTLVSQVQFSHVLTHAYYLCSTHLVPFYTGTLANFLQFGVAAYMFYAILFDRLFTQLNTDLRHMFWRFMGAGLLFTAFHTLLLRRHGIIVPDSGGWYYGTLFAVVLVAGLAILLHQSQGIFKWFNRALVLALCIIFAINGRMINQERIDGHILRFQKDYPEDAKYMRPDKKLTRSMVKGAWEQRDNPNLLQMRKRSFPLKARWLFDELDYIRKNK